VVASYEIFAASPKPRLYSFQLKVWFWPMGTWTLLMLQALP